LRNTIKNNTMTTRITPTIKPVTVAPDIVYSSSSI
jgi:hypothetical protein